MKQFYLVRKTNKQWLSKWDYSFVTSTDDFQFATSFETLEKAKETVAFIKENRGVEFLIRMSCLANCDHSDYHKGGKCDTNGCMTFYKDNNLPNPHENNTTTNT